MNSADFYYLLIFTIIILISKSTKSKRLILLCLLFTLFSEEVQGLSVLFVGDMYTGQIVSDLIFLIIICPFMQLKFNRGMLIPLAIVLSIAVNILSPYHNLVGDFLFNNYEQINTLLFELIIMGCINKQVVQDTLNKVKITSISLYRKLLSPYKLTYLKYPYHLERIVYL